MLSFWRSPQTTSDKLKRDIFFLKPLLLLPSPFAKKIAGFVTTPTIQEVFWTWFSIEITSNFHFSFKNSIPDVIVFQDFLQSLSPRKQKCFGDIMEDWKYSPQHYRCEIQQSSIPAEYFMLYDSTESNITPSLLARFFQKWKQPPVLEEDTTEWEKTSLSMIEAYWAGKIAEIQDHMKALVRNQGIDAGNPLSHTQTPRPFGIMYAKLLLNLLQTHLDSQEFTTLNQSLLEGCSRRSAFNRSLLLRKQTVGILGRYFDLRSLDRLKYPSFDSLMKGKV